MPVNINVGLSKKIGTTNYGSTGASCSVQFEAGHDLLDNDLKAFHAKVQNAFIACRQAVQDELAHVQGNESTDGTSNNVVENNGADTKSTFDTSKYPVANGHGPNGNSHNRHTASVKQLDYARLLAKQVQGLGIRRLEALANTMFGKPLAALTSLDASGLIDTLKSIKAGEINLNMVLEGAAA